MPTTISHTVDPNGTGDYTSLSAWEAAQQRDLVSEDEIAKAVCISSSGGADDVSFTATAITGWTTDATRYCWVTGESDPHGGKWNTNTYRITGGANPNLNLNQAYTLVEMIQVEQTHTTSDRPCISFTTAANHTVSRCITRSTTGRGNGILMNTGTGNIINCLAYDFTASGVPGFNVRSAASKIYNCTAYNCNIGFTLNSTSPTAKNCLAQACTNGFNGTWDAASTNNCSDIASDAPGSSPVTGTVSFVDTATDDFHLASGDTVAKDAGADLSADTPAVTIDVDGTARPQGSAFDIGFDEVVVAAGTRRVFVVT